jgi:multidrug efflux pump
MPIIFMTGLTGALFKEFAFALAGAVVISGFVGLTLSPMMCSKLLPKQGQSSRLEVAINQYTSRLSHYYQSSLRFMLRFKLFILGGVVIIFGACYGLYVTTHEELAPKEDMGGFITLITAPASANLNYTAKYAQEIDEIYKQLPETLFRLQILGVPNGVNSAFIFTRLKSWDKRERSLNEILASLFPKIAMIPGVTAFPINPYSLPGSSGLQSIHFTIKSTGDYAELEKVAEKVKQEAQKSGIMNNVDVSLKIDKPQYHININRNLAGSLGISMQSIGSTINLALGEPEFNRFTMRGRSYYVIPQLTKQYRNEPKDLNNLNVRTDSGELVPLANIIHISENVQPQALDHFQQMRAAAIKGSPAPDYTTGDVLNQLNTIAQKYMTSSMQVDYGGQSRQFVEAQGDMIWMFILALIFIFLVLAAQFESFRDPFIVLFSVPLSTLGALIFLKLSGGSLNIYTQIGLVTLAGLISKHGILMVEFANQLQQQRGYSVYESIVEAARIRLRPVLMTTAAMILGVLPLAMASGPGAYSRNQMGMVIIGGMTFGTLFTLYVVPTMYLFLAKAKPMEAKQAEALEENGNEHGGKGQEPEEKGKAQAENEQEPEEHSKAREENEQELEEHPKAREENEQEHQESPKAHKGQEHQESSKGRKDNQQKHPDNAKKRKGKEQGHEDNSKDPSKK